MGEITAAIFGFVAGVLVTLGFVAYFLVSAMEDPLGDNDE